MEDQQPDSGDLTTDASATDDATDDKAPRRRHRMPLRQQLAVSHEDDDGTADSTADETPVAPEESEPAAAPRRRWRFLRRRSKTTKPSSSAEVSENITEPEEATPAPRTPVGKAGRTAKTEPEAEPEAAAASEEEPVAEEPVAEEAEQILVPHRPAGKRLKIAAVTAGVLFVGAAAFAGATVQPYLADRALVQTKLDVAETAARAITTLWTYTPDNMESLPDRSARYLGGDFANEYRKYIDAIVAPNKQAQVTNVTEVKGAAVETLTPSEATAIVYTNSVATSPVTKNIPSLRYLSYRLTMERRDAQWLITRMSTVTSLDLTPQL